MQVDVFFAVVAVVLGYGLTQGATTSVSRYDLIINGMAFLQLFVVFFLRTWWVPNWGGLGLLNFSG